jgi:poly(A) polymerase
MRASTLKRFIRLPRFDEHLALHRLDCLSSHRHLDAYDFVRHTLEQTPVDELRPVRLLNGHDLESLGYRPGPLFSKILRSLEDAQLEGLVKSREEAIAFVAEQYGKTASGIPKISSASG